MQEDKDAQIITDLMRQAPAASSAAASTPQNARRTLDPRNNVRINVHNGAVVHQINIHNHARPMKGLPPHATKEGCDE